MGGHDPHAPVAEQVVLAVQRHDPLAGVVIHRLVEPGFGVALGSLDLAVLDDHRGVGQVGVPAAVVDVEVRIDDPGDAGRIDLDRAQPRGNVHPFEPLQPKLVCGQRGLHITAIA